MQSTQAYKNRKFGFRIDYPASWKELPGIEELHMEVQFVPADSWPNTNEQISVAIIDFTSEANTPTLDEFTEFSINQLRQSAPEGAAELLNVENSSLGGVPSKISEHYITLGPQVIWNYRNWTIRDKVAYVFTYIWANNTKKEKETAGKKQWINENFFKKFTFIAKKRERLPIETIYSLTVHHPTGFSVNYPNNWKKKDIGSPVCVYYSYNGGLTADNDPDVVGMAMWVTVEDLPKGISTLEQYTDLMKYQFKKGGINASISNIQIHGESARRAIYNTVDGKVTHTWIVHKGKSYNLSCSWRINVENDERPAPLLDRITDSFRITDLTVPQDSKYVATYDNLTLRFQMKYDISAYTPMAKSMGFVISFSNKDTNNQTWGLGIMVRPSPVDDFNMLYEGVKQQLAMSTPDFKIIAERDDKLGGEKSKEIHYRAQAEGKGIEALQILVFKNQLAYIFHYSSSDEDYKSNLAACQKLLNSVRFY